MTKSPYAMVRSTTRMRGSAALEADGVIDHREDSIRHDDEPDARHYGRGGGESRRGGAPARLHAAHAARDGDEHAEHHALDEPGGEVRRRGGLPGVVPVGDEPDLEHPDAYHGAAQDADH